MDQRANWFDRGGEGYAMFRPDYPPELAATLAGLAPGRGRALDLGCGTGQLTRALGAHFNAVIGIDPSRDQIAHARPHPRVTYLCAPAEKVPLADQSLDLITAAQAAHWFDLSAVHAEARRLGRPGAVVAWISYGVLHLEGAALNDLFLHFYHQGIGPFWPPERRLVDGDYAGIDFPFDELPPPALTITRDWDLDAFLGYLSTWSATRRAAEAGQETILTAFARDLAALWGDPARTRRITWPINMRIGRVA